MTEKKQDKIFWAILATETSHVFCCVLPTLFSLLSLLTVFGVAITIPGWLDHLHGFMHQYEVHAIIVSALAVAIGWVFHYYSIKNDCHDHGCHHKPCGPRKRTASKILKIATLLLAFNLMIYFGFHRGDAIEKHSEAHAYEAQSH